MKGLLDEGYEVTAFDDYSNNQVSSVYGKTIEEGDVSDLSDVEELLVGTDAVLHLGAVSGVDDCDENPRQAFVDNVVGTENVAWFCRENGTPLVFPCSMAIIGDPQEFPITRNHPRNPLNTYGFTKRVGEENVSLMSSDEFPAHVYMKSNVYGQHFVAGERVTKSTVVNFFIDRAKKGEPLTVYEPGTQARDFIHVKDVAEAYVASVENLLQKGETGVDTFEIASGRSTSIFELANLVAEKFGEEEGVEPEVKMVENPRSSEALVDDFQVDASHARNELGWEAERGLDEAIVKMI